MTATIPTTLTEYQQFVRKEALQVQLDMGLTDDKLNAMLRNLGLPEKRNFYVPVEVTGTMIAVINVNDAMTEAEARDKIAELSDTELAAKVRTTTATGHFTSITGKVTTLPDTFAVGDPDLTLSNTAIYASMQTREERRHCESYRPGEHIYCTLRRGSEHTHHVAGDGIKIVAVWPNES